VWPEIFQKLEKSLDSWYRNPIIRESLQFCDAHKGSKAGNMTTAIKSRLAAEVVVQDVPES